MISSASACAETATAGHLQTCRPNQPGSRRRRSATRASVAGRSGASLKSQTRGRPMGSRRGEPRAGARLNIIDTLRAVHNAGLVPYVPSQGSVGASGDLAPLSHMTLALMGEGEFVVGNTRRPAAEVLCEHGIAPLQLQAKEGLALINGTQVSTALALHGLFMAERLLEAGTAIGALCVDAAKGSDAPFDPRIHAVRGQPGQIAVAAATRALLAGSQIRLSHVVDDERVQDPYSLRCQPQVMGACRDLINNAARTLLTEANAVTDNPLVFTDTNEVLSGGNFHAEPVAFAADMLAMAVCEIGSISERRTAMLVDPALSGLPAFLTPKPGLNSGFMIPQVTAAALVSENKQRAYPASVDSIPTSANQEDHVSMGWSAARKLRKVIDNLTHILGIELLTASRAVELRKGLKPAKATQAVITELRKVVDPIGPDRFLSPELERASLVIKEGRAVRAAKAIVASLI